MQDKKKHTNTKIAHIIIHGNVSILLRYNEQLIEAISFNRSKLGAALVASYKKPSYNKRL